MMISPGGREQQRHGDRGLGGRRPCVALRQDRGRLVRGHGSRKQTRGAWQRNEQADPRDRECRGTGQAYLDRDNAPQSLFLGGEWRHGGGRTGTGVEREKGVWRDKGRIPGPTGGETGRRCCGKDRPPRGLDGFGQPWVGSKRGPRNAASEGVLLQAQIDLRQQRTEKHNSARRARRSMAGAIAPFGHGTPLRSGARRPSPWTRPSVPSIPSIVCCQSVGLWSLRFCCSCRSVVDIIIVSANSVSCCVQRFWCRLFPAGFSSG